MQPQHVTLGVAGPGDLRMQRWVELIAIHVGQSSITFSIAFSSWLDRQHIVIEEHPYTGMHFHGDPELILPVGAQWGARGKLVFGQMFLIFKFLHVFVFLMFPRLN